MGKYFGTDGFRGEAGITLTADHAYKVGRFLGWYYNVLRERNGDNEPARIVIGKDTRRSSYMFEYSLVAGLTASGADAYLLHVTTTPSVAYIARVDDFDCGIMISASHNPYYDNGIKLIDCYGEKMPEETLLLVEDYIDGKLHVFDKDWPELPFAHREHIGCTVDYVAGRNRYMGYLISLGIYSFKGVKVGLDCANGSSWNIAKSVFDALGADTYSRLDDCEYVELLYHPILQVVILRKSNHGFSTTMRWRDDNDVHSAFSARAFSGLVFQTLNWKRNCRYQCRGICQERENAKFLLFELDESRILIGKNHYEQADGYSMNLECRLYRHKWVQGITARDVMEFGQVVENPMIGAIPSRNEVQRELDDLLMSM